MAAVDRDYVLGIGVTLQVASIAELEAQIKKRLESVPPLVIKVASQGELEKAVAAFNNTKNAATQAQEAVQRFAGSVTEAADSVKQISQKFEQATQGVDNSMKAGTDIVKEQMAAREQIVKDAMARQQSILDDAQTKRVDSARKEAEAHKAAWEDVKRSFSEGGSTSGGGQLIMQEDPAKMERRNTALRDFADHTNKAAEATKNLAREQEASLVASAAWVSQLNQSFLNIARWNIGMSAYNGVTNAVGKGFTDAIHAQQEQVVQGFYYQAQGQKFTPQMSDQTMNAAIGLARQYGDEVVHVQEAIGLWAKSTHGELLPSIQMASDALKLNAVTGMNNEEIYRSTIAVLSQYHTSLDKSNNLYEIGVGLATKYGGGIKMIGGESQDAARQMIEAMDASSAVAASFGLHLEQSAGMAATLIHAGNYDSGKSAGEAISRSLAALERGKPEAAMEKMGIALHNNSNILDELVAKWNTSVPGMGKSLGDVITASVQGSALEPLKLLINQVGLVKQATADAYEFEKSHPLEAMFAKMQDTDSFKINQIKASIEAISITIARQFLPGIASALDNFEKLVPAIMAAAPQVKEFAEDMLRVGTIAVTWEVFKLISNYVAGMAQQWVVAAQAMTGAFGEISAAERLAQSSLTDYERTMIGLLTDSETVTEEMGIQFRALAATYGVSIDAMITEFMKLKGIIAETATSVNMSEESMALTMQSVAGQMGVEEEAVAASFAGMATAAESSASAMGLAFLRIIPIIGQAITLGALAKAGYDWVHSKIEADRLNVDKIDPHERYVDENKYQHDISLTQGNLDDAQRNYKAGIDLYGPNWGNKMEVAQEIQDDKDRIAQDQANLQGLVTGSAWNKNLEIKQQLAANSRGITARLAAMKPVPPGFDETGAGGGATGAGPKPTSDFAQDNTGVKTMQANYDSLIQSKAALVDVGKAEEEHWKSLISIQGNSQASTAGLIANYGHQEQAIRAELSALGDEQRYYQGQATSEYAKAKTFALNSKEYRGWQDQAGADAIKAAGLTAQIQRLSDELAITLPDAAAKAKQALIDFNVTKSFDNDKSVWKVALDAFKGGSGNLGGLEAAAANVSGDLTAMMKTLGSKNPALLDSMKTFLADIGAQLDENKTKLTDFANTSSDEARNGISADTFELSSSHLDSWVKSYAKAVDEIENRWDKFNEKYQKDIKDAQGDPTITAQLTQAYALQQQWEQSALAVAKYNEQLEAAKNSPDYKAYSAGIDTIGSSFSNWMVAGINNGPQNSEIGALQSQLSNLDYERSMISSGPYAKYHTVETTMMAQQAQQIQEQIKRLEEQEKNPPIVKKVFEEMEKSLTDTFVKKFEDSLKQQFIDQFMGKQQTLDDKQNASVVRQITAIDRNTDALNRFGSGGGGYGGGGGGFNPASSIGTLGGLGIGGGSSSGGSLSAGGGTMGGSTPHAAGGSGGGGTGGNIGGGVPAGIAAAATIAAMSGGGARGGSPYAGTQGMAPVAGLQQQGFNTTTAAATLGGLGIGAPGGGAAHKGFTMGGALGVAGDIGMAIGGYQQGGVRGSIMAGLGTYESLAGIGAMMTGGAAAAGGLGALMAGPWGLAAAAVVAGLSLFHPHYSPSANPDMYADDGFAQGAANAQGAFYTQANGMVYEQSDLASQLGGKSELGYMVDWYNLYPNGAGLNSDGLALWNKIGTVTGNGKGVGIGNLHQGNISVLDQGGAPIGMTGNWQNVLQTIDQDTQDLYTLLTSNAAMNTPIISVAAYGGTGQNPGFSPWYTPGLSSSDAGAAVNAPYGMGVNPAPTTGMPTGGTGSLPSATGNAYNVNIGDQNMQFVHQLNIDGTQIAQYVNAYNNQRQTAGFMPNT